MECIKKNDCNEEMDELYEEVYNELSYMEQLETALLFHMNSLVDANKVNDRTVHEDCISEILNNVPKNIFENDEIKNELKKIFLSVQLIDDFNKGEQ